MSWHDFKCTVYFVNDVLLFCCFSLLICIVIALTISRVNSKTKEQSSHSDKDTKRRKHIFYHTLTSSHLGPEARNTGYVLP